jgi:hypothetical protein
MALKFRCSKCGKRLTVDGAPGEEVTCPHCSQAVAIPADAESVEVAMGAAPASEPEPQLAAPSSVAAAPPAEQEEEEEPVTSDALSWVAVYLPSWGTSVVLHVAVFVLMTFMAWQQGVAVQPPFEYKSDVVQSSKPKVEKRIKPKDNKKTESRGKLRPGPSSIVRQFTNNPFPDVASNNLQQLQVIGVGGGGSQIGGFEGLGNGRPGFFGVGSESEGPKKIVYIVDRSGSMTDSIDFVKYELKRSIGELSDEKEFHVIFFSSGPPVEMPSRRLVNATERNKQMAFEFIDSVVPQGETDPSKALERAFACGPEIIYFLTDGEFDKMNVDLVKRSNAGGKVVVHTIGFLYRSGEALLKQIAEENGGNYKFVSEADLATLTQ